MRSVAHLEISGGACAKVFEHPWPDVILDLAASVRLRSDPLNKFLVAIGLVKLNNSDSLITLISERETGEVLGEEARNVGLSRSRRPFKDDLLLFLEKCFESRLIRLGADGSRGPGPQ